MLAEFRGLLAGLGRWALVFVILAAFFFLFRWPGSQLTPAVLLFQRMKDNLLPAKVQLIVSQPLTPFLLEVQLALFLALVVLSPLLLWSVLRYIAPALRPPERRVLYGVVVPASLLFVAGCLFAYFLILPLTIGLLYNYVPDLQALPFFDVSSFVSLSLTIMLVTGLAFLLPVLMFLSSYLGLIKSVFWGNHWRVAIFVFVLVTAIITPDGSGITMAFLLIPLCLLYLLGFLASRWYDKNI